MIGVAFALQGTFGTLPDIEGSAFDRALRDFAGPRGLLIDARKAWGASLGNDIATPASTALLRAFSSALCPYLLKEGDGVQLETMFRTEAARLATDRFVAFDDVAPTLSELAGLNVPCIGLSGGWPSVDSRKAQIAGFTSPIIFAEELGVEASAPVAFARVCQALLLPADRIWFVGTDVNAEILPAAAAGLRTIWLNREGETFPAHRIAPDATVSSFADILGVLSEPYTRGLLALRYIVHGVLDRRPRPVSSESDEPAPPDRS